MIQEITVKIVVAFVMAYLSGFLFKWLSFKVGLVDAPDPSRKVHSNAMPLLGGACIFVGVLCGLSFCVGLSPRIVILLAGCTVVFILNVIDDAKGLSAKLRLFIEIAVALAIIILADAKISFLPSGFWGDAGEVFITLIWFVGLTNALNCMDGLDGLAGGIVIIASLFFGGILLYTQQVELGVVAFVLVGATCGFMLHNFPKAKMFLGDSGSTFLGFMLAGFGVMGNWAGHDVVRLAAPILILGVPIFDMMFTTVMRIRDDKVHNIIEWMKYTGKDHFHHSLIDIGFTKKTAVYFIWLVCVVLGLSGVLVRKNMDLEAWVTLFQAALIFLMIGALLVIARRKRSGWERE